MSAEWGPPPEPLFTTGRGRGRAAVPRHRRAGGIRVGAGIGVLLVLVGVIAAGGLINSTQLTEDDRLRPFVITGGFGERVSGDAFALHVLEVSTAAVIADRPGWRHNTAGVWVLVRVQVVAHEEVATIGLAEVRDSRGRSWSATDRIDQPLADHSYRLQPGVPVVGAIAFEVPAETADDLTLRLGRGGSLFWSTVVEVALPVEEAMLAQSLAESHAEAEAEAGQTDVEPVLVPPAEVVLGDPPVLTGVGADR